MKAITYENYGPPEVLKLVEIKKPTPKCNEVLIRIYATTVTSGDSRMRKADPFIARFMTGLFKPTKNILGFDISGVIESIGKNVTRFKVGDEVFGSAGDYGGGTYREYKCLPEDAVITTKPENLPHVEAAPIFFGAHSALHFLRKGNIQVGQKVLIYGASGSVGTYAVQLAKYYGAQVTAVCSTSNIKLAESLGASKVIDYTKEDFSKRDEKYDIIFDTVGKSPFWGSVKSLKNKGFYLLAVNISLSSIFKNIWAGITTNKKIIGGVAHEYLEDLVFLKKLIEEKKIKPVIDKIYPLEQIADAHRLVDSGRKRGNVVITIS